MILGGVMGVEAKPVNAGKTFKIEVKIRKNGTFNSVKVSDGRKWEERFLDRPEGADLTDIMLVVSDMVWEVWNRGRKDER